MKFPSLEQITSQAIATFKRFPLAVISALITISLIIYLIEVDGPKYEHFETLIKIAFTASLGVFMFTALRLLGDKNPLCLVGIVSIVGYYFVLPDMKDPNSMIFERHFFLNLMFFIIILWASYWKSSPSNEEFWEWTQRVMFGFLTSILFAIILYAGLSGAIFSIDKLFSLDIDGKRYAQLIFLVMGLFGVNYFLSQIPKNPHKLIIHAYTKIETIFAKYIITPLVIFYFLILYTYTFKILATGSFPKGILAWIIIAFSAVAVITYLFWTPLWSERAKKYRRFLFLALFLQTIMLGVAISMRVTDYAWTEHRYMVALLGIWLFGISLYFLVFKNAKYKWIFITLTLFIMLSQIGPFSAYAIGKSSQQNRLQALLEKTKPLSEKSDIQDRYEVSDMIRYLDRRHGVESLKPIIPEIVTKFQDRNETKENERYVYYDFPSFATKELGFNYVNRWDVQNAKNDNRPFSIYRPQIGALAVSGYDWMVETTYFKPRDRKRHMPDNFANKISKIDTTFRLTTENLEIKEANITIANIPLVNFYKEILTDAELKSFRYEPYLEMKDFEKLNFDYKDENVSVKILIFDIHRDQNSTIENIYAKILYKRF
ncbi:MAG TPA: DUF4153 domain-containing protein [Campylobacterales bacterium]|nr:DUF4153 domain-containing protein [Campylobacterales bacterium]